MGKLAVIGLILIFILIFGGLTYIYLKNEKPSKQENKEKNLFANVSIKFFNENVQVSEKYFIYLNNFPYKEGNTLEDGYVYEKIPLNNTLKIFNSNLTYYVNKKEFFIDKEDNYRIDLDLVKPGKISIFNKINDSNKTIYTNIICNGECRELNICLNWGVHIITMSIGGLNIYENKDYSKCFVSNKTLKNEEFEFIINYKNWGIYDPLDFVDIFIIDQNGNINKQHIQIINNI